MSRFAAALAGIPRPFFPLLLLLLLLLLAVIVVWGFRRSRLARWLVGVSGRVFALAARAWEWVRSWLRRVFGASPRGTASGEEPGGAGDPLADHFENPELLAGLNARQVVIRTYHLVLSFAEMLGHGRHPGQTPFEYAHVLSAAAPGASESTAALTWAYAAAMYGGEEAVIADPSSVRDCWNRISSALTAALTDEELTLRHRAYVVARRMEIRR